MTLHIKKIMEGMLICTVLESQLDSRLADYAYKHIKRLVCKGFNNILLDMSNVKNMEDVVAEKLYELHKLMAVSGGSLQVFGVNQALTNTIEESKYGYMLNIQRNEVIEPDITDLLFDGGISLVS